MQKTATDPMRECSAAESQGRELRGRHDAVLARGDASDQKIHMNNCRIAVGSTDLCHYCVAYVQL